MCCLRDVNMNITTAIQIFEALLILKVFFLLIFPVSVTRFFPSSRRYMLIYENFLCHFDLHFSVQASSFTFLQTLIQFPACRGSILLLLTNVWQLARGLPEFLSLQFLVINQKVTRYVQFCLLFFLSSVTCFGNVTKESNLVRELPYIMELLASTSSSVRRRHMGRRRKRWKDKFQWLLNSIFIYMCYIANYFCYYYYYYYYWIFKWYIPASHTVAMASPKPLTEVSTRSFPGRKGLPPSVKECLEDVGSLGGSQRVQFFPPITLPPLATCSGTLVFMLRVSDQVWYSYKIRYICIWGSQISLF
jgi:hypothetical protein